MLSQHQLKLLTAYVDGEMDRRERKALLRLLHKSPEARSVLLDLQEAARRVHDLPRPKLGEDFTKQVLQALFSPKGRRTGRKRPGTRPVANAIRLRGRVTFRPIPDDDSLHW
jgi:anti-sigma factor RsiW